jgi:protein phosphatase
MMLSSDGLHGVVAAEEIESILGDSKPSLEEKCNALLKAANAAGSPDNVTVMLLRPVGQISDLSP